MARGLCDAHYQKRRIHGDPQYQQVFNKDQPCSVRGCGALQKSVGFCGKHYQRRRTHGDPLVSLRAEVGNGSISVKGYRIVFRPGHPNANRHGRLPEHRLVMSEMLARPLLAEENVHHINGNRLDNRPENLELWVRTQPCGQRVQDLVEWAQSILERYGPLVNAYLPGFDPNSSGD